MRFLIHGVEETIATHSSNTVPLQVDNNEVLVCFCFWGFFLQLLCGGRYDFIMDKMVTLECVDAAREYGESLPGLFIEKNNTMFLIKLCVLMMKQNQQSVITKSVNGSFLCFWDGE